MYTEIFKLHCQLLKAIANPKRLEIIHLLRNQELTVTEMQQMLGLPQANLSQHLQILREYKVVDFRRYGKEVVYRLSHPNFIQSCDAIREILLERSTTKDHTSNLISPLSDLLPTAIDPVCGMRLTPKTASHTTIYRQKPYYFCASGCLHSFKKNPQEFINSSKTKYVKTA